MVDEKRCLKRDADIRDVTVWGFIKLSPSIYSYPDKCAITNLLSRRLSKQLKGGYKR
jgi:hypothetical protein